MAQINSQNSFTLKAKTDWAARVVKAILEIKNVYDVCIAAWFSFLGKNVIKY